MSKLPKASSDRLLNLLYTATAKEVSNKVPIVTKHLYANQDRPESGEAAGNKSEFETLLQNPYNHKPMIQAMEDMAQIDSRSIKSTVLRFRCPSSLLTPNDFYYIYPINRERQYLLNGSLHQGLTFSVVKGRNPTTLMFNGSYYLIFPNYNQACIYWLETKLKYINGFNVNFEFVDITESSLKNLSSPFLKPSYISSSFASDTLNPNITPIHKIFKESDYHSKVLEEIFKLRKHNYDPVKYTEKSIDPIFHQLNKFVLPKLRQKLVLVKNLPFNLSKYTLSKLLWNYDLEPLSNQSLCFTTIINDPLVQTRLTLIRFADSLNARRFVRNFHGRKWDNIQFAEKKERKVYDPILCELLE
ncbi:hypothetical protein HYPBUDRAFT_154156 [Hyphopichia burtonii NRRL Y-1933]|uniref:Uncharacterized protein n=1 Tax=Hyphopichia burtonii NRRL Y-1933 TaxID=984485 RepID=A0A1E4RC63_9ASCO|nr:hypothetical protein HYPBUDRAFT_154156 [Hyphopichia burtonii NRRL Y-1933]ODV64826.1 hypothetical protein HYPBUDRAFT_154156 [Hyphopichia burtonii NRRL Y-1933]